jgi:hypothetical protein
VESLCEYEVGWVVRSQRVGFIAVVAGKREEVSNLIVVAFDMLGGEAMGAVEEDRGEVSCDFLNGFVAHGGRLDAAGAVYPTEGGRIVA